MVFELPILNGFDLNGFICWLTLTVIRKRKENKRYQSYFTVICYRNNDSICCEIVKIKINAMKQIENCVNYSLLNVAYNWNFRGLMRHSVHPSCFLDVRPARD